MTRSQASTENQSDALLPVAAAIRLAVFDVDGVLTDGRLYYGADGEALKVFNVRDGHGLKQLQRAGITLAVISGRGGSAVSTRLAELGIEHVHLKISDKAPVLKELTETLGIPLEQCAYMGDDEPDIAPMRLAGLAMTVADAAAPVLDVAHWISHKNGGQGAVREACDMLLAARRD